MGSAEPRVIPVSEQFSPPSVPLWDSISNVERQVRCEMDGAGGSEAPRRQDGDGRSVLSAADGYRLGRRYFAPGPR